MKVPPVKRPHGVCAGAAVLPVRHQEAGVPRLPPARKFPLDRYEGFPTFYYKKEMELPLKGIRTGKVRLRKFLSEGPTLLLP